VLLEAGVGVELVGVVALLGVPAVPAELPDATVVGVVETLGVMLAGVDSFAHAAT
jgi:hypothetical protein